MREIFLTKDLKSKYMEDFNNIIHIAKKFWEIDNDFLKEKLILINSNENVQTLYSKYGIQGPDDSKTYLEFAFSNKIELNIFRYLLPELLQKFNSIDNDQSNCFYSYSLPRNNNNYRVDSEKFGMRCCDDKDYFRINTVKINLETYDDSIKRQFWTDVALLLSELN